MKKQKIEYSWWDDPKNAEEVRRISWWEHPENKTTIEIPVSIIQDDKYWIIGTNDETKKLLGDGLGSVVVQAESKEEAIKEFFLMLKVIHEFTDERMRSYERWVPFRKGPWKSIGGKWFTIFGIHFYFRYGKGMKGGWYIPFTKLNISVHNEWKQYNRYKKAK